MRKVLQESFMADCAYKSCLEPYHDGELAAERSREFERHLTGCEECSVELRQARELSKLLISARPHEIEPRELSSIHDAVDEIANRSILRFAMGLSAIAASILIVSAAWLYDGVPARTQIVQDSQPTEQAWERWASTGQIDLPARVQPETAMAQQKAIEWMAVSLGDSPPHERP
jgi:anti-sigma factor RsiW